MVTESENRRFKVGMISKATHDFGTMLTYLETRISDTFGWSQDVLHKFDYVLCSVHMHEHEINYAGTFLYPQGGYSCVLMVSQIVQISWKT